MTDYHPAFLPEAGEPSRDAVEAWVGGFWKAMALDPAGWGALAEDERPHIIIEPSVGSIGLGWDEAFEPAEDIEDRLDEGAARSPHALLLPRKIAELRAARTATGPATRRAKIGRDDPCPCGSGKRYKRCCGRT